MGGVFTTEVLQAIDFSLDDKRMAGLIYSGRCDALVTSIESAVHQAGLAGRRTVVRPAIWGEVADEDKVGRGKKGSARGTGITQAEYPPTRYICVVAVDGAASQVQHYGSEVGTTQVEPTTL